MTERVKEIYNIIADFGQLTSKYPSKKNMRPGDRTYISHEQYRDLAEKIAELDQVSKAKG